VDSSAIGQPAFRPSRLGPIASKALLLMTVALFIAASDSARSSEN